MYVLMCACVLNVCTHSATAAAVTSARPPPPCCRRRRHGPHAAQARWGAMGRRRPCTIPGGGGGVGAWAPPLWTSHRAPVWGYGAPFERIGRRPFPNEALERARLAVGHTG
eukprot:gene20640-biopygen4100